MQIEQCERRHDLNTVAELKYGKLPQLEKELQAEEARSEEAAKCVQATAGTHSYNVPFHI